MSTTPVRPAPINSPAQVLFASLVGTTIEFFDFYIFATAAVLVFPKLFFPASDPVAATFASLATFGVAFLARPVGSALFGHFGDRLGRKTTLVLALLCMGLSTLNEACHSCDVTIESRCQAISQFSTERRQPGARDLDRDARTKPPI